MAKTLWICLKNEVGLRRNETVQSTQIREGVSSMQMTYVVPPKLTRPFEVGDVVDTMTREGHKMGTQRITKVLKTRVITDCGRRWNLDGWWQDEERAYPFPWIRHARKRNKR